MKRDRAPKGISSSGRLCLLTLLLASAAVFSSSPAAADEPDGFQWTDRPGRNMYFPAEGLPEFVGEGNLLWKERTGGKYNFGIPPTIRAGRLLMGSVRRAVEGHGNVAGNGSLICYDLHRGGRIWQMVVKSSFYGLCSAPVVRGERVYVQGGDAVCVDLMGLVDGNDGPFKGELEYSMRRGQELLPDDGDILWRYDYKAEFGITGRHGHAGTPVVVGNQVWVPTSFGHGVEKMNQHVKRHELNVPLDEPDPKKVPWKPNIYVFDARDGHLIAHDTVRVPEVLHGAWSSLSWAEVDGRPLVFWGDGYGVLHAFAAPEPVPGEVVELEHVWHYDCNPREHRYDAEGNPLSFPYLPWNPEYDAREPGPSYIIGAPVFHDGKLYIATGRDYHYDSKRGDGGPGALHCIDPRGSGDISESGRVWMTTDVGRSANTVAVTPDGLLFIADNRNALCCFDADTGERYWSHELDGHAFYCSPLVADGKVYIGSYRRDFHVLRADRELEVLSRTELDAAVVTPTCVDGLLVVPTWRSVHVFTGPGYEAR